MQKPTICFTQDTMFEIFKQSTLKFGLKGSAKIYVTEDEGVLKPQFFGPEEITPGGVPKVIALGARGDTENASKEFIDSTHKMD